MKAMQFADSQKARIDAAERKAMRRMIHASPLPPHIKQALLQHSRGVQFSDDGREIPSVPLKWTTDAAVAVQFAVHPVRVRPDVDSDLGRQLGSSLLGTLAGGAVGSLAGPFGTAAGMATGAYAGSEIALRKQAAELARRRALNARLHANNKMPDVSKEEAEKAGMDLSSLGGGATPDHYQGPDFWTDEDEALHQQLMDKYWGPHNYSVSGGRYRTTPVRINKLPGNDDEDMRRFRELDLRRTSLVR